MAKRLAGAGYAFLRLAGLHSRLLLQQRCQFLVCLSGGLCANHPDTIPQRTASIIFSIARYYLIAEIFQ